MTSIVSSGPPINHRFFSQQLCIIKLGRFLKKLVKRPEQDHMRESRLGVENVVIEESRIDENIGVVGKFGQGVVVIIHVHVDLKKTKQNIHTPVV